ncbi:hypothetical protein CDD83_8645 [Cordyceps sp. RAO-2017]|nr:hypothetical protein CDD83_8645 [Cordyceps sp. RAO-2017]
MAGHFDPDPELCLRYAQFAAHLKREQFKILYWTMFMTNLFILFVASWIYTRSQKALDRYSMQPKKRAKSLRTNIFLCLGCVAVSTTVVVMEAFALMALQFCDGEDLMSLYWSTWTMVQVGSLIAMVGIILAMLHSLRDRKHPPWALALGTPVLVIAGFLHLFYDCTKKRVKKARSKDSDMSEIGPPISQEVTIAESPREDIELESKMPVEFIGSTIDGGPIVRFLEPGSRPISQSGELLGYDGDDDRPIVAYPKGFITFVPTSQMSKPS